MKTPKSEVFGRPPSLLPRLAPTALIGLAMWVAAVPAEAAFHLWNIREIYTDASGSRQFIEMFTSFGSQQFVAGQQIQVNNVGNTQTHTFTIPSNLPGDSTGHALLLATAGLDLSGAPTADYIIPADFLFAGGGSISFFGSNSGTYTALPTDGHLSRIWGAGNTVNSPQNFAGQIGTVGVPEPAQYGSTALLLAICGFGMFRMLRR